MEKLLLEYFKKYKYYFIIIFLISLLSPIIIKNFSFDKDLINTLFLGIWLCLLLTFINTISVEEEKSGVIQFITSLPLKRKDIVTVKFILVYIISSLSLLFYYISIIILDINKESLKTYITAITIFFVAFMFINIIFFPLYYKHGYDKAQWILVLTIIGFGIIILLSKILYLICPNLELNSMISKFRVFINHKYSSIIIILLTSFLYFVSYVVSCRNFKKKDF